MIVNTIWGKAYVLYYGPGTTLFVRMLSWTPEHIKAMGGEKEAWILIDKTQIID